MIDDKYVNNFIYIIFKIQTWPIAKQRTLKSYKNVVKHQVPIGSIV